MRRHATSFRHFTPLTFVKNNETKGQENGMRDAHLLKQWSTCREKAAKEERKQQKRAASLGFGKTGALDKSRGFMQSFVQKASPAASVQPPSQEPSSIAEEDTQETQVCTICAGTVASGLASRWMGQSCIR